MKGSNTKSHKITHGNRLSLYYSKDDEAWLKELRKYAASNKWSVSLAVRELMRAYFVSTPVSKPIEKSGEVVVEVVQEEPKKLDPDTYFAQVESKLAKSETGDIDKQVEDCVTGRLDKDGKCSCYFFDNAREHHSFCKQHCWTDKTIWGKRVRL